MPDARCSNEVGVVAERGETQIHFFERNEAAPLLHDLPDIAKKDAGALHDASAEDDGIRREQVDEVGEANREIEILPLYCSGGQRVAGHRVFVDVSRGESCGAGVFGMRLHPLRHSGAGGERLPAAAKTTGAWRTACFDDLMRDLGMRAVDTAIEMSVQNDAAADASTYDDVDKARFISASTPCGLGQRARIGIVLYRYGDMELAREIVDG